MKIEFVNNTGMVGCELKEKLTPTLLSMILKVNGLIKQDVKLDTETLIKWSNNLNNNIMVISPSKLVCGIRVA